MNLMPNQPKQPVNTSFTDQDMLTDALSSQKLITDLYNTYANECASPAVMSEMMNILNEEHQIQHELFQEMQKRGWYQTEAAPMDKINEAKTKFQSQS